MIVQKLLRRSEKMENLNKGFTPRNKVIDRRKGVHIFFDMDGVLVDFNSFVEKIIGQREDNTFLTREQWEKLIKYPDLYLKLLPLQKGIDLYLGVYNLTQTDKTLFEYHINILTAIPREYSFPLSTRHKREWATSNPTLKKYPPKGIFFGPYSEDKQYHCMGDNYVLIDDNPLNIKQWESRGGVGIQYEGDPFKALLDFINRAF
jgi:hypothetical protein